MVCFFSNFNYTVKIRKREHPRLDSTGVATRLLSDLADQVKKARSLSTQFTKLGNVDKAAMMEKWASTAQRDYDMVRMATKRGDPMPRVNYEKRQIQIIKRFNDLRFLSFHCYFKQHCQK